MNTTYSPEGLFPQELRADSMTREQLKRAYNGLLPLEQAVIPFVRVV